MNQLYTDTLWEEWLAKEQLNYSAVPGTNRIFYKKRGYLHFDHRYPLPQRHEEIRRTVRSQQKVLAWGFYPFLKVVLKTSRFKYNKNRKRPVESIKERPICYAAHKDSLIYSFYAHCLTKRYEAFISEAGFADSILAYRTDLDKKSNIQFAGEVVDYIRQAGECTVIALDIESFFDTLKHSLLKRNWVKVTGDETMPDDQYKIFKTITRFAYVDEDRLLDYFGVKLNKLQKRPRTLLELSSEITDSILFRKLREKFILRVNGSDHDNNKKQTPNLQGIPQGSPISAVMSNIYMIDFDAAVHKIAKDNNCLYRRYSDDILLICSPEFATEFKEKALEEIDRSGLKVQQSKVDEIWFRYDDRGKLRAFNGLKIQGQNHKFTAGTEHRFYKSLQYLGFEYNGQDVRIRTSSICRFERKMKRRITKSVKMAYSINAIGDKIKTKTTFLRYSHIGKRNFPKYVYNSASDNYYAGGQLKARMNSIAVRRQIARHSSKIKGNLSLKNEQRYLYKISKGISVKLKRI